MMMYQKPSMRSVRPRGALAQQGSPFCVKVSECSSGGLGPRHTTDETLIRSFRGEELFRQREALLMQSYSSLSSFFLSNDFPQVIAKPTAHKYRQWSFRTESIYPSVNHPSIHPSFHLCISLSFLADVLKCFVLYFYFIYLIFILYIYVKYVDIHIFIIIIIIIIIVNKYNYVLLVSVW